MDYRYEAGGQTTLVRLEVDGEAYLVTVGDRAYRVKVAAARPGELALEIEGQRRCLAYVTAEGPQRWVAISQGSSAGQTFVLTVPEAGPRSRRGHAAEHEPLQAQMPGIVRRVLVAEGDAVSRGQVLVLLEAMKMEIRVTAPEAGVVTRVAVAAGQAVERGQALVEVANLRDGSA